MVLTKVQKKHLPPLQSVRIPDQLRERIRYLHYSLRTEQVYVYWVRAFIRFYDLRQPADMGKADVATKRPGSNIFQLWCIPRRYPSTRRLRQYSGSRRKCATATMTSFSTRQAIENGKFFVNTRRVPCFHGDPAPGSFAANALAASTALLKRVPSPRSIFS